MQIKFPLNYFCSILLSCVFLFSCESKSGSGNFGSRNNNEPSANATEEAVEEQPVKHTKANFNIYIENSGSMNGYVNSGSDFKNAVLGIITDIKSRGIAKDVNIYYINNTICPQKLKATAADIQQFFMNLNPQSFQNSGCGTRTSFMPEIIRKTVTANPDDVNILISDFIFSDSMGTSQQYLELAKNSLVMNLSEQLKKGDFSSIIVKMNSNFNGRYFIESQRPKVVDLTGKDVRRPYYLLITGKNQSLNTFLDKTDFEDYTGYENSYYLLTPTGSTPKAKLVRLHKKGNFDIIQPATSMSLANAAAGTDGIFQFSYVANLEFLKIDESFITDVKNYTLPANYEIVSIEKIGDDTNESLKGFTHIYTIATSELKPRQDVPVKLKANLPGWISKTSTLKDADPLDSVQQTQTFGFKYLAEGISQAYNNAYDGKEQFSVNIKISKNAAGGGENSASSGFPWWIILVAALAIGGFIFLKSKK